MLVSPVRSKRTTWESQIGKVLRVQRVSLSGCIRIDRWCPSVNNGKVGNEEVGRKTEEIGMALFVLAAVVAVLTYFVFDPRIKRHW